MKPTIVLDSGPLGLVMQRRGLALADRARLWLSGHISRGVRFIVPELADYEVRRELLWLRKTGAVGRLDVFIAALPDRYMPLTTAAMRPAAQLWADTRQKGYPTADPKELDGDVIIAAQVLSSGIHPQDLVVATTNPVHLARFLPAELWQTL